MVISLATPSGYRGRKALYRNHSSTYASSPRACR